MAESEAAEVITKNEASEDEEDLFKSDDDDDDDDDNNGNDNDNVVAHGAEISSEKKDITTAEVKSEVSVAGFETTQAHTQNAETKSLEQPIPRQASKQNDNVQSSIPTSNATNPNAIASTATSTMASTSGSTTDNLSKIDPAKFGLPAEVLVPQMVQASLLQGRLLETLQSLPVQLINDALAEYSDAVQIKGNAIRNHGAYLFGVIKRYVSVQQRASTGGEGQGVVPMGQDLTPTINGRLKQLVMDGFCTEGEMNEKVKNKLRMLSEKDAMFAIDELSSVERRQIRNFGSYFMGILNRYMRGDTGPGTWARKQDQKRQRDGRPQNQFDDQRRDERFHRGRDPEPSFRQQRDNREAYRRERSRDRFEPDRRNETRDWREQYDPRQPKPPFAGQFQHHPMGGIPGNPPPPPPRTSGPGLNPYQPSIKNTPLSNPPFAPPPPPPPPPRPQMNPPQFVPQAGGPPQSSPYGHASNPPYHQRGPGPQTYNPSVSQPPFNPPQGGMGVPHGIRGKPQHQDSYGAGMNQPPMMGHHQSSHSYVNPQQASHNPPPHNRFSQPPQHGGSRWQNPQAQGGPVDILGLADKAASVVQALQSQNKVHPGAPPNMPQYGGYNQGAPGMPTMSPANHGMAMGQKGGAARRRTTAAITELPITVQYAVQNLQTTGQIDGPLDEGMLGMVKDLPENLALGALSKFSSIDKNTMRNKTAYLAGVLRRELEKINRR